MAKLKKWFVVWVCAFSVAGFQVLGCGGGGNGGGGEAETIRRRLRRWKASSP